MEIKFMLISKRPRFRFTVMRIKVTSATKEIGKLKQMKIEDKIREVIHQIK